MSWNPIRSQFTGIHTLPPGVTPQVGWHRIYLAVLLSMTEVPSEVPSVVPARVSYPSNSRGTRLDLIISIPGAILTQWGFIGDGNFTHTTGINTGASGSVLDSGISFIDIWLPPFHTYLVRIRQYANGDWAAWSSYMTVTSRGLINSYENYSILNANTQTI